MKLLRCVSVVLFLCFVFPLSAFADTWAKAYEVIETVERYSGSVQVLFDGGTVVANTAEDHNGINYASILKLNEQGNVIWHKYCGADGIDDNGIYVIRETLNKEFILAGSGCDSSFNVKAWIFKLGKDGNVLWSNNYGLEGYKNATALDIQETSDGGFIIYGSAHSSEPNYQAVNWVLKLDNSGNVLWSKKYIKETGPGWLESIQETSDGGFIIAGDWILRLDKDGNVLWQKSYDSENRMNQLNTVKETSDNGFIVVGYTSDTVGGIGSILKLDHSGNIVWQSTFGFGFDSRAEDVQETSDGMFIVVGYLGNDVLILKWDQNGNLLWQKVYGVQFNSIWQMNANTVDQTPDGGYIVGGTLSGGEFDYSGHLVLKLDHNGNIDQCDLSKDLNLAYDKITFQQSSFNSTIDVVDTQATMEAFYVESRNANVVPKPLCPGMPAYFETDCKDGIDNNNDGFTDCEDPGCHAFYHYCSGEPYLYENFSIEDEFFIYKDDVFNATDQATYASGRFDNTSGNDNTSGVHLTLGGKDGKDILDGISGGWVRHFGLYEAMDATISIDYRMVTTMFDADECAQVLVRVDDNPAEVLDEACGRGIDTGWKTGKTLKSLDAGSHSLAIGGFVNKKTGPREKADIYFDNIDIREEP